MDRLYRQRMQKALAQPCWEFRWRNTTERSARWRMKFWRTMEGAAHDNLPAEKREQNTLRHWCSTTACPQRGCPTSINQNQNQDPTMKKLIPLMIAALALSAWTARAGDAAELYEKSCVKCHGA